MNLQNTYCNPIKSESYPKGYEAPSHRSLADPSVLFYYKIQVSADNQNWQTVVDKSKNEKDYKFDYEAFDTVEATHVRLVICGTPAGIEPGVISFTVFGKMDA